MTMNANLNSIDWSVNPDTIDKDAARFTRTQGLTQFNISGPDATKFLQGQLSCDVNSLAPNTARWGAHCNPKGRVVSNFLLQRYSDSEIALILRSDLLDIAQKQLAKYIVFSKASIEACARELFLLELGDAGVAGLPSQWQDLPTEELQTRVIDDVICTALGGSFYLASCAADKVSECLDRLQSVARACSEELLEKYFCQRGIALIHAQQSDEHLPQSLNMDLNGGVSFKKGCYTGQEIVARLHFRGKSKKRLLRYVCDTDRDSMQVYDGLGNKAGEIITKYRGAQGCELLALVSLNHDGELFLDEQRAHGLQKRELPYTVHE